MQEENEEDDEYYGRIFTEIENLGEDEDRTASSAEVDQGTPLRREPGLGHKYQTELRKAEITIRNAEMGLYEDPAMASGGSGIKRAKSVKTDSRLNSLIAVLLALQGGPVSIELKNDDVVNGTLESVDARMNCTLVDVQKKSHDAPHPKHPSSSRSSGAHPPSPLSLVATEDTAAAANPCPCEHMDSFWVKGSAIRFVMPPASFRPRRDVAQYLESQEKKGRVPKLWL
jgi:small nuclear ribonucleoprotein (snRNP)-like protein